MTGAGAKAQLMNQPSIELVGPADIDRARVALVITDVVDQAAAKVVRAIQRDGIPKVVLVAGRFEESGVVAAVAAGVTSFLRRSEATSARLTEVIREADRDGCQLPEGLLKMAATAGPALVEQRLDGLARVNLSRGEGSVATLTSLHLTAREAEVLRLVADGYDTTEIAEQLAYSESTIKGVLAKIMTRLEARNRCHAVAIVVREGLL
jgi:DNA-binding NarL/FixJ family response regulator